MPRAPYSYKTWTSYAVRTHPKAVRQRGGGGAQEAIVTLQRALKLRRNDGAHLHTHTHPRAMCYGLCVGAHTWCRGESECAYVRVHQVVYVMQMCMCATGSVSYAYVYVCTRVHARATGVCPCTATYASLFIRTTRVHQAGGHSLPFASSRTDAMGRPACLVAFQTHTRRRPAFLISSQTDTRGRLAFLPSSQTDCRGAPSLP